MAENEASAVARTAADDTTGSEAANNALKEAAVVSEDAARFAFSTPYPAPGKLCGRNGRTAVRSPVVLPRQETQGKDSSSDGRKWSYRPRGNALKANASRSSSDGSGESPVPEATTGFKMQVVPSLAEVASYAAVLGRLTMSDYRAMPVSVKALPTFARRRSALPPPPRKSTP